MDKHLWKPRKVVITGAGEVGSNFAYALAINGAADEVCLYDLHQEFAKGQAMDLSHGEPFYNNVNIKTATTEDYADAHVIVITAGAKQKSGETRLDLLKKNSEIITSVIYDIKEQNSGAVIIVVTNPVDVLTYAAWKHSGFERSRVIGSGTVLDSSRFRYILSRHTEVDIHNIHAYILGEHGDSEFAAWSMTNVAGMPVDEFFRGTPAWNHLKIEIQKQVRQSAYHIIDYKGATSYGVGQALVRIVGAILRDKHSILTVSTVLNGEYGLSGLAMGVPSAVAKNGAENIMEVNLSEDEKESMKRSANILEEQINKLGL